MNTLISLLKEYTILISCIAIIISLTSLFIAILNYRRKSNIALRTAFTTCSDMSTENKYIGRVIIENTKDRSVAIFGVYLHIKPNIYITLSNFESKPLIIKAFDTEIINYDRVFYYNFNLNKVNLNNNLNTYKKLRIVVSTTNGKHIITKNIKRWLPAIEIHKNPYAKWGFPIQLEHDGQAIGSNILYLLEISISNVTSKYWIHKHEPNLFGPPNINLDTDIIKEQKTFEDYLNKLISTNEFLCDSYKITKISDLISIPKSTIEIQPISQIKYNLGYILGKLKT